MWNALDRPFGSQKSPAEVDIGVEPGGLDLAENLVVAEADERFSQEDIQIGHFQRRAAAACLGELAA